METLANPMTQKQTLSIYEENIESFLLDAMKSQWLVIDYETDGSDVRQSLSGTSSTMVQGVSFAYQLASGNIVGEYVSFNHMDYKSKSKIQELAKFLISKHPRLIVFNMRFELDVTEYLGIEISGRIYCCQMMAHYLDQGHFEYSLDRISRDYKGNPKDKPEAMKSIISNLGWAFVPFLMMREYSVTDAVITLELFNKLYSKFCSLGFEGQLWDREVEKAKVLNKMERVGLLANKDFIESEIKIGETRMAEIVKQLQGRNPKSPNDCYYLLVEKLGLPIIERTDKGKPSFNKEAMKKYDVLLQGIKDPTAKLITEFRGWQTAISLIYRGALDNIQSDGRVRGSLLAYGTKSSRLSGRKPNLTQLPKTTEKRWNGNAKRAYKAPDDYKLIEFDYAQLELRITVSIAKEEKLMEVFQENRDLFDEMSEALSLDRDPLKTFVYSTSYGAGAEKVAHSLGISLERAEKIRSDFKEAYPKVNQLARKAVAYYKHHGYIKLWTGRRVSKSRFSFDKEFAAFNWLIQGSGAEIVTTQMIRLDKLIDWDTCKMVLQVHDSLVFEIKEGTENRWIPLIKETMEDLSFTSTSVPFKVSHKEWGMKNDGNPGEETRISSITTT